MTEKCVCVLGTVIYLPVSASPDPSSHYVITLKAFNNMGEGIPVYESAITRPQSGIHTHQLLLYTNVPSWCKCVVTAERNGYKAAGCSGSLLVEHASSIPGLGSALVRGFFFFFAPFCRIAFFLSAVRHTACLNALAHTQQRAMTPPFAKGFE